MFDMVNGFVKGMSGLFLALFSFAVIAEILLGGPVFGMAVIDNIMDVINNLGNNGVVGIITIVILFGLLNNK